MAIAFFGLLMIAALTTSLPIYEVIITVLEEMKTITNVESIETFQIGATIGAHVGPGAFGIVYIGE